ncbi:hypothetical protein M501DRAFT_1058085 [Patellaria atrata CBS 101060]|uniref:Uncharacterized protein n=1 Tax=Patellaria atrata CBS 101060 TaxID=1346257 RepID=A0A9P4VPH9_9PEZI|nr:hypothetical protein M501DRAFT_1058085 [Patellaria atrata CBS 101060]
MPSFRAPFSLLSFSALFLTSVQWVAAKPYPQQLEDRAAELIGSLEIFKRDCANPCGWAGQLCCASGQQCYTDANNQAQCGGGPVSAAQGGYWQYYTTTWVETLGVQTYTSVYSSYVPPQVTQAAGGVTCNYALNESPCGSICCSSGQYCLNELNSQCAAAGGGSSGYYSTYVPPVRPTSMTLITVTQSISPTTTVPFETAITTGANGTMVPVAGGGGLSGGAIAGIVIGVIAGIILLILLCLCCCAKAAWDGILAIFGGKKRERRETEYIEEHHHHSGGVVGGGRWYGNNRPARPVKQEGGLGKFGGLGGVLAGLAGLAAILGLKRRHDRKHDEKTSYTGSSYSSYSSTSSASSSDRRTRNTRHSSSRR